MAISPTTGSGSRAPTSGWGPGAARLLLAGLLLLPLAACATKADVRDMQVEVRELHARQEALLRELQTEQRVQRDSIRAVSTQLEEHRIQLARTLREFEEQLFRVQELAGVSQQELAALRDQMERRPLPQTAPTRPLESGGEARELFDVARTQLRRESLTTARMGFEDLIERFPNHELTPDARYFLAEIHVRLDELDEALEAFSEIPRFHPDSERVPDAYYRIGRIHADRDELDEARMFLERVVNSYPDSPAAEAAERALRELR